jgi:phage/plasmid-associated DNA primase
LFQAPTEPLPYLFFYGRTQNSGKSSFHQALNLLLTRGYKLAEQSLINSSGFNGELRGAIICVVEEIDLNKDTQAYNRIKAWVLADELSIHIKGKTPFHAVNTTHWIQCANDHTYCPVFGGDTRIVMSHVGALSPTEMIPWKKMRLLLEKEAPDFLASVLNLQLPESPDRFHIPPIETEEKKIVADLNRSPLERFLDERCKQAPGHMITFMEFHARFMEWIEADEVRNWGKIKTSKAIPPNYPKARVRGTSAVTVGNIAWIDKENLEERTRLVIREGYLEPVVDGTEVVSP